jgi:hypothetical protein
MSPRWKPQFSWGDVFLIALGLALIGSAIYFRSFGAATTSEAAPFPWSAAKTLFESIGVGLLFVLATFLGAYFGFVRRLRRPSGSERQGSGTRET